MERLMRNFRVEDGLKLFGLMCMYLLVFSSFATDSSSPTALSVPQYDEEEERLRRAAANIMRGGNAPHHVYGGSAPMTAAPTTQPSILHDGLFILIAFVTMTAIMKWEEILRHLFRVLPTAYGNQLRVILLRLGLLPRSNGQGAASPEAIARLETIKCLGVEGDCSVCLESFKVNDVGKRMPCKHLFHETCLLPWLQQKSSCPVCRNILPNEFYPPSPNVGGGSSTSSTPAPNTPLAPQPMNLNAR